MSNLSNMRSNRQFPCQIDVIDSFLLLESFRYGRWVITVIDK